MVASIPEKLKALDISRFAHRAAQLEKYKPAVAYWCNYWIVNQILGNGLHNADAECTVYTTSIMDKLEQMKSQPSVDDAIIDDVAGQVYIEQFALETFQRADNAIRANKASKQTADTFQAAATFLELLQIWHPVPAAETASKVKYAKFHALRIAKAARAGEDPNASNPVQDEAELSGGDPTEVRLDPADPDVQRINAAANYQPSVEDAIEVDDAREETGPPPDCLEPPPAPMPPPAVPAHQEPEDEAASRECGDSAGGGYFPSALESGLAAPAPSAPPDSAVEAPDPQLFYTQPEPPAPVHASSPPKVQPLPRHVASHQQPLQPPQPPPSRPHRPEPPPTPVQRAAAAAAATTAQDGGAHEADDAAVAAAQKHARWAISALNFEDVGTAVKELRAALGSLGTDRGG